MPTSLIAVAAILALFCSANEASAQVRRSVSAKITPEQINVSLHEPVVALLTVKNELAKPLLVDLGDDRISNIAVNAVFPDGSETHSRVPLHQGLAGLGRVTLPSEQSYSQVLVLDTWLAFHEIGLYKLRIEILSPAVVSDGNSTSILPLFATVKVGNRDEQRLTKLCTDLLQSLSNAKSYEDARRQAVLLSRVQDPIAVPFMQQAMNETSYPIQSIVVNGLESVGTPEAVRALVDLIGKRPSTLPDARVSLARLVGKISDVDLKREVQQVLEAGH